jgi:hypothetical protein
MPKRLAECPVAKLLADAAAMRSGEAIGFIETIVDGSEVENAAVGD